MGDYKERNIKQYGNDKNLNARMAIHKYNENKVNWHRWCFERMQFVPGDKVLELGCGNGALWKENESELKDNYTVILSDFSEGMLKSAQNNLKSVDKFFNYKGIDVQNIPYEDNTFDVVIARHMLYHVPDVEKALSEMKRVLKPGGRLYITTNGEDAMIELEKIVYNFDTRINYCPSKLSEEFGYISGRRYIEKYFSNISFDENRGRIVIDDIELIVNYVMSTTETVREILKGDRLNEFRDYLNSMRDEEGKIYITTTAGMFSITK